jgi:hypothetical protein
VYHNLNDTPLQLRTNSKLGSKDYVSISMRKDTLGFPRLYLSIRYYSKIYIRIRSSDKKCNQNLVPVTTLSVTEDRIWSIIKTPTSYRITGNDIEPLELTFNSLHCGKMAKTMNFSWLGFHTRLSSMSTAYYSIATKSKLVVHYVSNRQYFLNTMCFFIKLIYELRKLPYSYQLKRFQLHAHSEDMRGNNNKVISWCTNILHYPENHCIALEFAF